MPVSEQRNRGRILRMHYVDAILNLNDHECTRSIVFFECKSQKLDELAGVLQILKT
jgi:hypothetical protein